MSARVACVLMVFALLSGGAVSGCGGSGSASSGAGETPGAKQIEKLRTEQEASERKIEAEQQARARQLATGQERNRTEAQRQSEGE
jgi:hypothetical protein